MRNFPSTMHIPMSSQKKQSLASHQLQALLTRAEAVLAHPENKTQGQLAAAERVKRAVIGRSSRLPQERQSLIPGAKPITQRQRLEAAQQRHPRCWFH